MSNRIIKNRPYKTVEDIKRVKGIGTKTFEKIRNFIKVTD
jgi:DNA uptake protein ComE-like DNA-binding protein